MLHGVGVASSKPRSVKRDPPLLLLRLAIILPKSSKDLEGLGIFYLLVQNCLGAIDGTHVPIIIDPEMAAPYRNRKSTLSQNVMLACDFDLSITFISCGWEGSATDARVLYFTI